MEIKLGSKVKDNLTGFVGFATARCVYINGCVQYEVTPEELKDGVMQKGLWIDEPRLEVAGEKMQECRPTTGVHLHHHLGGPHDTPTRTSPPSLGGYEDD